MVEHGGDGEIVCGTHGTRVGLQPVQRCLRKTVACDEKVHVSTSCTCTGVRKCYYLVDFTYRV